MEAHGAIDDRYKWDEVKNKKSKKSTSLGQKQRKLNAYIR